MNNIIIIIFIIATVVFLIGIYFIFYRNKSNREPIYKANRQDQQKKSINRLEKSTKDQKTTITTNTKILTVIEQKRPSPERPVTKEDAIIVDLLRQNADLPGGIMELSQILTDPDAKIKKIVQIISTYPVLSAKILKIVNSAAFTTSNITSIQHAVVILGFHNLWLLTNQLMTNSAISTFSNISKEEMKALWRHGTAVATCAKHLLLKTNLNFNELAPTVYTCSLLHDVGKFMLKGFKQANNIKTECEDVSVLGEDKNFGLDHCRAAYLITTYWKLPEILCTTISYHHHPSFSNWQDIPKHARVPAILVAISDMVANLAGYYENIPCTLNINPDCLEYIGLDKKWNPNILLDQELFKELKETERLIETATSM